METKSPEFFFETIKKKGDEHRFAFVLGNGINRYLYPAQNSWDHLAEACCREFSEKDDPFIPSSGISNTEMLNLLEFHSDCKNEDKEKRKQWKKRFNDFLNKLLNHSTEKKSCELLIYAWNNAHILTTNFDNFIEEKLGDIAGDSLRCCQVNLSDGTSGNNNHRSYRWNNFYSVTEPRKFEKSPLELKQDLWHIHGKLDCKTSDSVLFSLTRYVNAIKKVENWGLASEKPWAGENTWVNIFYNCPLIIAGLGLTEQEVFLRTLLIERKRHWQRLQKNHTVKKEPASYYLVTKDSSQEKEKRVLISALGGRDCKEDGRSFLSALGFHIVEFASYDDLYNNKNWNK